MHETLIEGLILGFTLSIMIGPVFFAHLQTSMYRGFWAGNFLLAGIVINDISMIFLSYLGTAQFLDTQKNMVVLGFLGGIILIIFGIISYRKKIRFKDMRPTTESLSTTSVIKYFAKGFLLNVANPFVWIFWIGVVTLFSSNYSDHEHYVNYMFVFFGSVMGVYTVLNVLKGVLAFRVKRIIKPRSIMIMNKSVGILLMVFGIILILRVILVKGL
ncbi:LysE family translocator [Bacteroidota bacterium]